MGTTISTKELREPIRKIVSTQDLFGEKKEPISTQNLFGDKKQTVSSQELFQEPDRKIPSIIPSIKYGFQEAIRQDPIAGIFAKPRVETPEDKLTRLKTEALRAKQEATLPMVGLKALTETVETPLKLVGKGLRFLTTPIRKGVEKLPFIPEKYKEPAGEVVGVLSELAAYSALIRGTQKAVGKAKVYQAKKIPKVLQEKAPQEVKIELSKMGERAAKQSTFKQINEAIRKAKAFIQTGQKPPAIEALEGILPKPMVSLAPKLAPTKAPEGIGDLFYHIGKDVDKLKVGTWLSKGSVAEVAGKGEAMYAIDPSKLDPTKFVKRHPEKEYYIYEGEIPKEAIIHKRISEGPLDRLTRKEIENKLKPTKALEDILPKPDLPIQRVLSALKGAKVVRGKQETLFAQERGKRLARSLAVGEKVKGEKGFYAELGQLKGKLPKAMFESIRDKVSQEDIDSLFVNIKDNPNITVWDKISAREGLAKLFGEFGGVVPTKGEIGLLRKVFGPELTDTLLAKRPLWKKAGEAGYQLINIPRSIMASFDLSAPLRQGIFLIGRKPFWTSFPKMFKYFGNEKSFNAMQDTITQNPDYELMRQSKLSLTEMTRDLTTREEEFMSSWAEKIPGVGRVVRASGRAYVGFLNKLRADVFSDMVDKARKLELDPDNNLDLSRAIAHYINAATGRGALGPLEHSAVALNSVFFSPRLMASRLTLLNPAYYVTRPPFVRKQALRDLFTFTGLGILLLTLAKMAGAKIGNEPRSSDFGKIRIGDTRIDMWGGFQPYVRMAAQLITGKYVSSTTGKEYTLGEGYKPLTRYGILQRQIEGKFSPAMSFAVALLKQQTFTGEPVSPAKELGIRFVPMVIQDMYDLIKEDPRLLPLSLLAIFGAGVQTYSAKKKKRGLSGLSGLKPLK